MLRLKYTCVNAVCGYKAQFVEMGINIGSLVGAAHIGSKHFIQSCCIDFKAG